MSVPWWDEQRGDWAWDLTDAASVPDRIWLERNKVDEEQTALHGRRISVAALKTIPGRVKGWGLTARYKGDFYDVSSVSKSRGVVYLKFGDGVFPVGLAEVSQIRIEAEYEASLKESGWDGGQG